MINRRTTPSWVVRCDGFAAGTLARKCPGVDLYSEGVGVACATDALPVVLPHVSKPMPDLLEVPLAELPGYIDYQQLLERRQFAPRDYQVTDAVYLANREYALLANPMRCLDGDTEVMVNRRGNGRRMRLADLVYKFNGGESNGRQWDLTISTRIAAFDETSGCIKSARILAVHSAGVKKALKITVTTGQSIICSEKHQFRTPLEYVRAKDLEVGCEVLIRHREAPEDHARTHAFEGMNKNVLFKGVPVKISAIEEVESREMFDLTIEAPYHNYVANEFVVHNSGKTMTALLGAVLAKRERILVVCPSISKWVWGDEIYKWLGEEALIVEGLSRSRALVYCGTCQQSGRLSNGKRCPACRQRNGSTYGYRIIDVQETQVAPKKSDEIFWHCRKHPEFTSSPGKAVRCEACKDELRAELEQARIVIVNYDILAGRGRRDKRGRIVQKKTEGGWADVMAALPFDLAVIDESHMLRGFEPSLKKTKTLIHSRVQNMTGHIPAVWCVTGTPIFGMVRDLYGQLNVMTNGLMGSPADWAKRYCDAKRGEYGWDTTGRSNEEELQARLATCMVARARSEILQDMPAKQRRVLYLENDKPKRHKITSDSKSTIAKMIDAIAVQKHNTVIANVLPELSEGLKVYVLTFRPKHAERLAKELAKKMNGRDWRTRMNAVKAEVFVGQTSSGIDPKRRRDLAKAFCAHQGAAVFVATILSMPGSISLKGVTNVHMVDFDTSPSSMEQAEDRGYEPGTTGYSITHYVVRNSIDDHLAAVVIPKFETKDRMLNDENAQNVLGAFANEQETLDEVLERHTAHLSADEDDDDWV